MLSLKQNLSPPPIFNVNGFILVLMEKNQNLKLKIGIL